MIALGPEAALALDECERIGDHAGWSVVRLDARSASPLHAQMQRRLHARGLSCGDAVDLNTGVGLYLASARGARPAGGLAMLVEGVATLDRPQLHAVLRLALLWGRWLFLLADQGKPGDRRDLIRQTRLIGRARFALFG